MTLFIHPGSGVREKVLRRHLSLSLIHAASVINDFHRLRRPERIYRLLDVDLKKLQLVPSVKVISDAVIWLAKLSQNELLSTEARTSAVEYVKQLWDYATRKGLTENDYMGGALIQIQYVMRNFEEVDR